MIYILIDTCIIKKDLISKIEYSPYLKQLKLWVDNNFVRLLFPEPLKEEWEKHRSIEKSRILQAIKVHQNQIKRGKLFETAISEAKINRAIELLESQITDIDALFNQSIFIPISDNAKIKTIDHKRKNKAPFHKKKDSDDDALMFFSSMDYLKENKIEEFFFISANYTDFANNPSDRIVHQDLLEEYNHIQVNYYAEIKDAFNYLIEHKNLRKYKSEWLDSKMAIQIIRIDRSKPFLDQLFDWINLKFKEINFLPIQILIQNYPFKREDSSSPSYSLFILSSDNEELMEFFGSIQIQDNKIIFNDPRFVEGVANYEEKTKSILSKLTRNLIFNIHDRKRNKSIDIRYIYKQRCNCVACNYTRLNFNALYEHFNSAPTESDNLLKDAYIHYQTGNYITAAEILTEASQEFHNKGLKTSYFISQYNLKNLYGVLRFQCFGKEELSDLLQKIHDIDLDVEFSDSQIKENKELLEWIKDDSFYSKSRDKIQKAVGKVRDHFYLQQRGGWSSNQHVWMLINAYAEIDSFVNNNYILFDGFEEFLDLTDAFIEGIFAALSINESQGGRLTHLDDWMIQKILFYGKPDRLIEFFKRYNLKKIFYEATSTEGDTFFEMIDNFSSITNETENLFFYNPEYRNFDFRNKFNRIFGNILILAGKCELTTEKINEIAEKFLTFLKRQQSIFPFNIKYLTYFLDHQGNKIQSSILKNYLISSFGIEKLHDEELIKSICGLIKDNNHRLTLTNSEFDTFKKVAFNFCNHCRHSHRLFIVYVYQVLSNKKQREIIKDVLEESLNMDFDPEFFYLLAMFDIIGIQNAFFRKFMDYSIPDPKRSSFKKIFSGIEDNRYMQINDLINLCYKYNIDLTGSDFDRFRGIDPYYDWLLDMKGFNYNLFQPQWVSEYRTKYYERQMKQNKIIKELIFHYLKNNNDVQLERAYIKIFGETESKIQSD